MTFQKFLIAALMLSCTGQAWALPSQTISVNTENFVRAESDVYMQGIVDDGGFGKFKHARDFPL